MTQHEKPGAIIIEFLTGLMGCDPELVCGLCHRFQQLSVLNGSRPLHRCLLKALCNHCQGTRSRQTEINNPDLESFLKASMPLLAKKD